MVYNKSAHIQIERKARRTWRTPTIIGHQIKNKGEEEHENL